MCFESSQLAYSSKKKLVWVPHTKIGRFWLMRRTAVMASQYYYTTKHLGLLPTHLESTARYLSFSIYWSS